MASFFGMEIRSKEEQAQEFADFSKRIFPYGEGQKDRISQILHELFPREDRQCLMVYYVSIKDEMTGRAAKSFEAAAEAQMRTSVVRITPELVSGVRVLIMADREVNEDLNYPAIQELRERYSGKT